MNCETCEWRDAEVGTTCPMCAVENVLKRLGYRDCGLNAEWNCSAYRINRWVTGNAGDGDAGVYLLDNEDDTYCVVFREDQPWSDDFDDIIYELTPPDMKAADTIALLEWIERVKCCLPE